MQHALRFLSEPPTRKNDQTATARRTMYAGNRLATYIGSLLSCSNVCNTHTHTHIHICSLSMLVCNTYTVTTGPRLSCSSDSERECLEVNDIGDFYVSADHQQSIHWHKPLTHFRVCTQGTVNSHCTHATLEIHQQQQPTVQICVEAPFSVQ